MHTVGKHRVPVLGSYVVGIGSIARIADQNLGFGHRDKRCVESVVEIEVKRERKQRIVVEIVERRIAVLVNVRLKSCDSVLEFRGSLLKFFVNFQRRNQYRRFVAYFEVIGNLRRLIRNGLILTGRGHFIYVDLAVRDEFDIAVVVVNVVAGKVRLFFGTVNEVITVGNKSRGEIRTND